MHFSFALTGQIRFVAGCLCRGCSPAYVCGSSGILLHSARLLCPASGAGRGTSYSQAIFGSRETSAEKKGRPLSTGELGVARLDRPVSGMTLDTRLEPLLRTGFCRKCDGQLREAGFGRFHMILPWSMASLATNSVVFTLRTGSMRGVWRHRTKPGGMTGKTSVQRFSTQPDANVVSAITRGEVDALGLPPALVHAEVRYT